MEENSKSAEEIFIYAHDYSGSTQGVSIYFDKARIYLEKFAGINSESENVHYLLWSSKCIKIDLAHMNLVYDKKKTSKGTNPAVLSKWIIEEGLKDENIHLWLITDGTISEESKKECESLNYGINYKSFSLVMINQKKIDFSVSFAFANNVNCDCDIHIVSDGKLKNTSLEPNGYEFDKITLENFKNKFIELRTYAVKTFNVSCYNELTNAEIKELERQAKVFIENLKKKRETLLSEIEARETNAAVLFDNFLELTKTEITDKIKSLSYNKEIEQDVKDSKQIIIKETDFLISAVHNCQKKSETYKEWKRSISQKKFDKRNDQQAVDVPDADLEALSVEVNFHDCLSLCESQSPIICFDRINFIVELVQENKDLFIQTIDYPFVLIDNKEFLKKNSFVCQTYDSVYFKEYLKNSEQKFPISCPMTRAELIGGIIPYEFADAWNDYSVSCIFFKGKNVKRSFYDLFYFVLYKKLKMIESIDESVVQQLKNYALIRIKNGKSKLTLSSLLLEPKEVVPILISLLYCVQLSSEMFGQDPKHFKLEKLRYFYYTSDYIIEILQHFQMDIDEKFITERSELFRNLVKMKSWNENEKWRYILGSIFKVEDGFLINEIVAPEKLYLLRYLNQDMTKVATLNEVTLESLQDKLLFYYLCIELEPYTICEETCRPKFLIDGEPFYTKLMLSLSRFEVDKNSIKAVPITRKQDIEFHKLLSLCKIFIGFVLTKKAYPTFDEFKEYVLKRKQGYSATSEMKMICIFPATIMKDLKEIHEYYEPITHKLSVENFIKQARISSAINDKIEMESDYY